MRIRGQQDVAAGALVIAFAVPVLVGLSRIPQAKFQAIPPDLFPRVCTYLLILCGVGLIVRGLMRVGPKLERPQWRSVFLIALSVVQFGWIAPRLGYALAGFLTIVISGLAARESKALRLVAFAAVLMTGAVLLFTQGLSVPMPAFTLRGFGS